MIVEASYIAALGHDPSTPAAHVLNLEDDIRINSASDPTSTGDQSLTVDGQGRFTMGEQLNSRGLVGTESDITLTLRDVGIVEGFATATVVRFSGRTAW